MRRCSSRCGPRAGAMGRPGGGRPMQDFNELTKGAKTYEGFITLHEKDQHLYAEIKPHAAGAADPGADGDRPGLGQRRPAAQFRRRVGAVVPPGRRQPPAHPQEHPLHRPGGHAAGEGGQAELHRLDPDVAADPEHQPAGRRPGGRLRRHLPDRLRPGRHSASSTGAARDGSRSAPIPTTSRSRSRRPSAARRFGRSYFFGGPSAVVDPRGITMVMHYSLCKAPDHGYHPRMADYRVGHFLNSVTDFANPNPDTNAKRMINRWRLEKANPERQALAPQEADRLVHRGQRPRGVPALRPGGDPRVEQGLREDRLQGRHRRPLAERARRFRAGGHQLLHPALDHHRQHLRDVGPPQQPADRRDDRRRRDLRRELDQDMEGRNTPSSSGCRRPAARAGTDQPLGAIPLAVGEVHQPDHGGEAGVRPARAPAGQPPRRA